MLSDEIDLIFAMVIDEVFNSFEGRITIDWLIFSNFDWQAHIELKEFVAVVFLSILLTSFVVFGISNHRHFVVANRVDQITLCARPYPNRFLIWILGIFLELKFKFWDTLCSDYTVNSIRIKETGRNCGAN